MSCYHPVEVSIYRKAIYGKTRVKDQQVVPCGNCIGCRAKQARDWSIRIMHESRMHEHSWFLTLTYNDKEIPQNGSLCSEDFRAFIKAVRRSHETASIRYYGCGEYGESTKRPHYHAMLFGAHFLDRSFLRDSSSGPVWRAKSLEHFWKHGLAEFGSVTNASAAYVAGYVRKKVNKKVFPEAYVRVVPETGELVDIEAEFSRMSLKPAIGRRWIEKFWGDVYPRDFVVMDGVEFKPPRYYDKWLEQNQPEVMMQVREQRLSEVREVDAYTVEAREAIHMARNDLFAQRRTV